MSLTKFGMLNCIEYQRMNNDQISKFSRQVERNKSVQAHFTLKCMKHCEMTANMIACRINWERYF